MVHDSPTLEYDWAHLTFTDASRGETPEQVAANVDGNALFLLALQRIDAGTAEPLVCHAPPGVRAWALDRVATPTVAMIECLGETSPLVRIKGLDEPVLARVYAAEDAQLFVNDLGVRLRWLALNTVLTTPLYALTGWPNEHWTHYPGTPFAQTFAGFNVWPLCLPGAPSEEAPERLAAMLHDLGRAVAQLHYVWHCDGRGLAVVLAATGSGVSPPLCLHVVVDMARATVSEEASEGHRLRMADSLACAGWLPLSRTADGDSLEGRLDTAFREGYLKEASTHGAMTLAEDVLRLAMEVL